MIYEDIDGRPFAAPNFADLVHQLNKSSRSSRSTDSAFMEDVAKRILTVHGHTVRSDNPENFITDLIRYGFIQPVHPN